MSKSRTAARPKLVRPEAAADPALWEGHVFIRDLVLSCRIGVHQHERLASQRIRLNLDLTVAQPGPIDDDHERVVCYAELVTGIRHVVGAGQISLVETLADRIAAMCLEDRRVRVVRVRVEKLDVFAEAESVGVEIERRRKEG